MAIHHLMELKKAEAMIEAVKQTAVVRLTALSGTLTLPVFVAPFDCHIISAKLVSQTATSSSTNTAKYGFAVKDATRSLCSTGQATYQAGATNDISANTAWDLKTDQNLDLSSAAVLTLEVTKTGSPTSLSAASMLIIIEYRSNQVSD